MRKRKKSLIFLLFLCLSPLILLGGGLFFCCRNTGFNIDKITSHLKYNEEWEVDPLSRDQKEFFSKKIFPQKFYYLSSGNNCYAFISEDREYVLKFFKMNNLFPKDWLNSIPFLQKIGLGYEGNRLFSERLFASYKDAYGALREETALLYLHLNKKTGDFQSTVTLIDAKGKKNELYLDKVEYVVQKRAKKIFDHLNALVREKNDGELKECIRSFLELIAARCRKGFVDLVFNLPHDFGFVEGTAVQFDCASLSKDGSMKYPHNFRNEILQAAERLDNWAQETYPEASFFIQDEAQRIINHYSETIE